MDILTVNDQQGQYPASYYAATATPLAQLPVATGQITCDVCVIGGGFTGLSTALHLAEKGLDVVLVEAHRVGWGASGRNGGQVGTGQRLDQNALEKLVGMTRAKALWDLSLDSVALVKSLIADHKIDCGYVDGVIHADHRARFVRDSHAYAQKLQQTYGYDKISTLDRAEIRDHVGSDDYHGGTLDMGAGHLHPLNYALGLAAAALKAGVRIFENSRVVQLIEGNPAQVKTATADIRAAHVIVGANGYLGHLHAQLAQRIMPINNFIVATEPLDDANARGLIRHNHAVADSRFVINYFRLSQDNRMLFGGGENYSYKFPSDINALVRKPMLNIFPQLADARIDYAWGGTLGITMTRLPSVVRIGNNILSAGGFSGHGVALATLSGKMMAEAITGNPANFDLMAQIPTRQFPGGTSLRWPLLVLAMTWYAMRDQF
jgi:gamma-glutamylputrescine oxidase